MLEEGKASFGRTGLRSMLSTRIPNSPDSTSPLRYTPPLNRGQRLRSGSKKTGISRFLLIGVYGAPQNRRAASRAHSPQIALMLDEVETMILRLPNKGRP